MGTGVEQDCAASYCIGLDEVVLVVGYTGYGRLASLAMLTTSPDLKCRLRMVAVLSTAHRHGTNPYAFATEELARQARARYVGQWGHDELPGRLLPHDPETAIQEYFGATQGRESATSRPCCWPGTTSPSRPAG